VPVGPAGLAPLVWAARQGALRRLAADGLVIIERGQKIGAGTIGRYAIGSDTLAETFLECLEDSAELRLGSLREHPATLAVAAYRGGSVPLPLAAKFLEALGEAMSGAILSAGGHILTNCEAVRSRRRADGGWETRLRTTIGEDNIVSRNLVLATAAPFMHHYARSRARGFKMTRKPLVIPDLPPLWDTPAPYASWKPLPAAACQITPLRLRRSRVRPTKP
jgi:hypothetical protein